MKFELVDRQGYIPDLNYGISGQELSCFIPSDYPFQQVSYNNGEGEAIIDKHTWQFFFTQEGIGIKLIDGIVSLKERYQPVAQNVRYQPADATATR